jgi:hypothetical protein
MSISQLIFEGETWEISGNVTDQFIAYTNTVEASRSGKLYTTTESKARMVTVENVMVDPREFTLIKSFFQTCGGRKFNLTVTKNADCATTDGLGQLEYHYLNCVLQGELEFSLFENKVSNFEFAYESSIERGTI